MVARCIISIAIKQTLLVVSYIKIKSFWLQNKENKKMHTTEKFKNDKNLMILNFLFNFWNIIKCDCSKILNMIKLHIAINYAFWKTKRP